MDAHRPSPCALSLPSARICARAASPTGSQHEGDARRSLDDGRVVHLLGRFFDVAIEQRSVDVAPHDLSSLRDQRGFPHGCTRAVKRESDTRRPIAPRVRSATSVPRSRTGGGRRAGNARRPDQTETVAIDDVEDARGRIPDERSPLPVAPAREGARR